MAVAWECAAAGLRLLALLSLLSLELAAGARWSGEGTSPQLRSIFLGRCAEYIMLLSPQLGGCTGKEWGQLPPAACRAEETPGDTLGYGMVLYLLVPRQFCF
ncbi:ADP-ribosyl cyclase/cyclic ADP-ribose hydrolase 2-like isoform X2 [Cavia porcellus]|uniref:ADP-ribosyl cyclase/cyclic ADP-ribose hydrolase 2-like isoform X2 n=1 Tax=Cavia porcellus TaxID=10141 RepID=UPI002FE30CDA